MPYNSGRHAERGGNGFVALPLIGKRLESLELVNWVQRLAVNVLGKAGGFDNAAGQNDAGDWGVFIEALLLDEKLQRAPPAAACENAVKLLVAIKGPNAQALQKPMSGDAFREIGNRRLVGLAAHIAWMKRKFVERDARWLVKG